MDWIKKNPHLFSLAVLGTVLLAFAGLVINNSLNFAGNFSSVQENVIPGVRFTPIDLAPVDEALQNFQKPGVWEGQSLFVPERYVISSVTGKPMQVIDDAFYHDTLTKLPIPNKWFLDHNLPLNDPRVQFGDPDKDGFLNEDEWRGWELPYGSKSTDPNNKESHPPYYTKLFLKKYIRVTFRLKFQVYDGDMKKPEDMSFQINATDRKKSEFLKLGEKFPNTPYQLKKFEFKEVLNPSTGEKEDVSELTVLNTETEDLVVLPLNRLIDSPDSYALFIYEWPATPQLIQVKKAGPFALKPETTKQYKLLDIQANKAVILTPDGQKVTIIPDPRLQ